MRNVLNNLCAGGIVPVLIIVAVFAAGIFIYVKIMNRGKKCKSCGAKYDSSCIQAAKVIRTVKAAMGADMSDVEVIMKCKKCGKVNNVQITVKGDQFNQYLDDEVKHHFDK